MPNKNSFSTKLSFCQPAKRHMFFSQPSIVSTSQTYKPITMTGWALSLGSTSILFPGWHQPAVAVDLKIQNNNLKNLDQQPVLNVIQQFKTRLFPHLTKEKQSTFTQLPLLTSSAKGFNPSGNTVLVNFALNSDLQTNLIPQLPPLILAEASTSSQPVSYTHLTLPTTSALCRSRWSPYH